MNTAAKRIHAWILIAAFVAATVLFYFATRAAYRGYFSDDDLDKSGWPTLLTNGRFIQEIVTPKLSEGNFRPVGFLYYRYMARWFKLNYPPWVAVLQAGHLINVVLLFFLLRRFGFTDFAAAAGALLYVFHGTLIYIYWQPQYIFEVLAAFFCMLSLLLYMNGRWILALIPFWLAYKSKEIAVTLPVALLAWEWFLGERRWKRLIPYFLISLNFGLQTLWANRNIAPDAGYALNFSLASLWHTISFYAGAIVYVPYAGFALALAPFFTRDRRVWVGLIFTAALFVPMIALPSRLETVYWYIPMIGLTIAFAVLVSHVPRWSVAVFFLAWLPLNYQMMKPKRTEMLAHGDQAHWYVNGLLELKKRFPPVAAVVYQGTPHFMGYWGIEGALHQVFGLSVDLAWYRDPAVSRAIGEMPVAFIGYYPSSHSVKGLVRQKNERESYLRITDEFPAVDLGDGWYPDDPKWRWIQPRAEITLRQTDGARAFEIAPYLPVESIQRDGPASITVLEDGRSLGTQSFADAGEQASPLRWRLPVNDTPGDHRLTIVTEPLRRLPGMPRDVGVAVRSIGYAAP